MNRNNSLIYYHITSLVIGGLIYILFRSKSLKMFDWFDLIGVKNLFNEIRFSFQQINFQLFEWMIYSLPDGLWVFSYICLILWIWKVKVLITNIIWIMTIPILAICSELGQFYKLIPGTFDRLDLLFYLIGTISPFLLFYRIIKYDFKLSNNEKKI